MANGLRFHGCMPANLLPFTADLAVDEPAYRRHLRWLADAPGVTGSWPTATRPRSPR